MTLTVPSGVKLQVGGGLIVNGTLSVAGRVDVFGWINTGGDWNAHIVTSGSGFVYQYADLQSFAVNLYDWYSWDYGLKECGGA